MCLIAWRWQPADETPLVLLANRDEFYARPTRALAQWPDSPVMAGQDLEGGGTWLGVTASGKLAALTNYRDPAMMEDGRPSRGALVQGFLEGSLDSEAYLNELARYAHQYNPFNLLVFDGRRLMGCESRGRHYEIVRFTPGVGAVSNAGF
ncbi:MAG: NRDE family protein, partial [Fluviibacter sp.]